MQQSLQQLFFQALSGFSQNPERPLVVALSGGVDSMVTLELAQQWQAENPQFALEAVHVNHQLHDQAHDWERIISQWCTEKGVALQVARVNVQTGARISTEAAARNARYEALTSVTADNALIITGQHLSDQTETVLLQLKRGAGPKGLSGMGLSSSLEGERTLLRPLLNVSKQDIEAFARAMTLDWIDDHTNADISFDRNFLRHKVLPVITERWPEFEKTVARSASLCAENQALVDSLVAHELKSRLHGTQLALSGWDTLNSLFQRALLRAWIDHLNKPLPSRAVLLELQKQLQPADGKGYALKVSWAGVTLGRNRSYLFVSE